MNVIPITKFALTETLKLKLMPTSCFFLLHFQQKYERLATGSIPIESYLHEHLAEHLNSEIVLQTITDLASAMVWLRSTFLYVRALGAPVRYGLPAAKDKAQIERNLEGDETTCQSWTIKILTLFFLELCRTVLNALEKYSAIAIVAKDQGGGSDGGDDGLRLSSTLYGRLMAHYCISFQTVKLLRKVSCGTVWFGLSLFIYTWVEICDGKVMNFIEDFARRFQSTQENIFRTVALTQKSVTITQF